MSRTTLTVVAIAVSLLPWTAAAPQTSGADGPVYTARGDLVPPPQYRQWVYLSTGLNMSYVKRPHAAGHDLFGNVFVNREAYEGFLRTGTWPDKTQLVLEERGATHKGSINKQGFYQSSQIIGLEMHVKDSARFTGGWAFFRHNGGKPAPQIPYAADCYTYHKDHAAVDTTFVQFYPTLRELARKKGTLSAAYVAEQAKAGP
jgi:Cytochrome P460